MNSYFAFKADDGRSFVITKGALARFSDAELGQEVRKFLTKPPQWVHDMAPDAQVEP